MVGCLEEGLLNIKYTIHIQNRHNIERDVFKQIYIVLIVVNDAVKELKDDIERHLDRNSFASVMRTCNQHSWSFRSWLGAGLQLDQRDITALV